MATSLASSLFGLIQMHYRRAMGPSGQGLFRHSKLQTIAIRSKVIRTVVEILYFRCDGRRALWVWLWDRYSMWVSMQRRLIMKTRVSRTDLKTSIKRIIYFHCSFIILLAIIIPSGHIPIFTSHNNNAIATVITTTRMLLQLSFVLYFTLFLLLSLALGFNTVRIRQRYLVHPRIPNFIIPLIINYFMGNFVFKALPPLITLLLPCVLGLLITIKFQKVRILGITGSIATGKSTLTRLIRDNYKEMDIIDCDEISRKLRKRGQPGYKLIVKMLGNKAQQFLNPLTKQFQQEQRKKLNEYVFNNPKFRAELTHKMGILILLRVFGRVLLNIVSGRNVMMIDAPLLYETKVMEYLCFPVVVVGCAEGIQIQRLRKRDGYSQEEARNRIASQMPLSYKMKKCQIYLANEYSQAQLIQQFNQKIKRYLSSEIPKGYIVHPSQSVQKKTQLRTQDEPEQEQGQGEGQA